ncbi:hypothetical protein DFR30_1891 [Thiogranum longum]|uniref:Uncharacterized protein n=1 Tax=Thiogranum longum TaxID=1537524 RepID=A0A4R1HMY1_9GAMM|nr:hypothetical protein [Thiogranum longum]TCK18612.1 hypothetical protein DFR30_1891 [Thiogranum longum]
MKTINPLTSLAYGLGLAMLAGSAIAHDPASEPGTPVCTESNLMAADAQNAPFSNAPGPGRVLEMNITTGERGITVNVPFSADNIGTPICDNGGVDCPGPWKPTGVLSGGEDGHALITSAAQHAITVFHRDGTPIKTGPTLPTSPSPDGGGYGFVPRLLGSGYMPNGNVAQTVCDANFFNAPNSDSVSPNGNTHASGNASNLFFPPVFSTPERGANGRVLVYDQVTLEVVDEYSKPTEGPYANDPRWNCPAGVLFTSEGLFVSMFHGDAVFVIDWKDGIDKASRGVGSNGKGSNGDSDSDGDDTFKLGKKKNQAKIIRVIDLSNDGTTATGGALNYDDAPNFDSPNRRDNLRAIRMSEDGTLWGTRRSRSAPCAEGDACNPGVFRQHIFASAPGAGHRTGSLALDPGVNVIAGTTINRMSGPGCEFVQAEVIANGGTLTGDECDVETLYFGASAANPGCDPNGDGINGPGHPANQCFKPGGSILEYRMDAAHLDGATGSCTGDPADGYGPGEGNEGCAMPIAQFDFVSDGATSGLPAGTVETIDPRMVMTIHEAFTQ